MVLLDISNGWKTVIMILAMIAVFYFFLIRPQSQEAKRVAAYLDTHQSGQIVNPAYSRAQTEKITSCTRAIGLIFKHKSNLS